MSKKNDFNHQHAYESGLGSHGNETANRKTGPGNSDETLDDYGDNGMRICLFILMLISSIVMTIMTH